jgi:hypothetical protein
MERIPSPWPSREILNILVEKSSGYFIYASTIIKFIDDKDFRPTERLAAVVHWQNLPTDSDRPFEALGQLYTQIISCAPDRSRVIRILTAITHFPHLAMGDIELLLGLNPGDVALSLRRLHSIYDIPSNGHVSVYHASIPDFLGDPTRSDKFCVNTLQRRMELARSVLKALSGTYDVSIDRSSSKYMTRYAAIFSVVAAQWLTNHGICRRLASCSLRFLNSSVPSVVDLVPLILSINPDFLFHCGNLCTPDEMLRDMMEWLKVSEHLNVS